MRSAAGSLGFYDTSLDARDEPSEKLLCHRSAKVAQSYFPLRNLCGLCASAVKSPSRESLQRRMTDNGVGIATSIAENSMLCWR